MNKNEWKKLWESKRVVMDKPKEVWSYRLHMFVRENTPEYRRVTGQTP